jgi:hypothetical protein
MPLDDHGAVGSNRTLIELYDFIKIDSTKGDGQHDLKLKYENVA